MAQNITLMGASYADVPAVTLPKTGGGTAYFADTTDANATAADIASGKTAYVNGTKLTGTASGGGGASNVVTGTFKGTTTGAAMDVNLAYSGSGFPMAIIIFPSEGYLNPNGTYGPLIQRYATSVFATVKTDTTTPSYTGQTAFHVNRYKNSTSNATSMNSNTGNVTTVIEDVDATSSASAIVKIRSATKMSVFIASTSYGFAANIEYRYVVFYSS